MHKAGYNDEKPAENGRWDLGQLGYVLAVNAGLTTVSFVLIVILS